MYELIQSVNKMALFFLPYFVFYYLNKWIYYLVAPLSIQMCEKHVTIQFNSIQITRNCGYFVQWLWKTDMKKIKSIKWRFKIQLQTSTKWFVAIKHKNCCESKQKNWNNSLNPITNCFVYIDN